LDAISITLGAINRAPTAVFGIVCYVSDFQTISPALQHNPTVLCDFRGEKDGGRVRDYIYVCIHVPIQLNPLVGARFIARDCPKIKKNRFLTTIYSV